MKKSGMQIVSLNGWTIQVYRSGDGWAWLAGHDSAKPSPVGDKGFKTRASAKRAVEKWWRSLSDEGSAP